MRKICPFIEPCPLAMMEPKRLRNSFTITPESRPAGAVMAVTEEPGDAAEKSSSPSLQAAARVACASICAFLMRSAMPICLTYSNASPSARIIAVAGVQLDSPASPLFFSFFRLK